MTASADLLPLLALLVLPGVIAPAIARDSGRSIGALSARPAVIIAALAPVVSGANVAALAIIVAVTAAIDAAVLAAIRSRDGARTLTLVTNLAIGVLVLPHPGVSIGFNHVAVRAAALLGANPLLGTVSAAELHLAIVALVGIYLVTVELNHPIALILKGTDLMPASPDRDASVMAVPPPHERGAAPRPAVDEPARGRVIGYLERTIVFLLVLAGELAAVGFVIVAKGIARFQQLDDRDFAEYFLIGTLLSIVVAALAAVVFRLALR